MKRFECTGIGAMKESKTGDWIAYGPLAELLKEAEGIVVDFMDTAKNEPIVRKNGLSYKTYMMELLILKSKLKALEKE